jgi:site-specific recombinase XerD
MLMREKKPLTVRQHRAAIHRLFNWLISGDVVGQNPAASVRGPRHVDGKGRIPALKADAARKLLDRIDVSTITGLRDRALIALLIYSFARISAALGMNVGDYFLRGGHWWIRLHEKRAKIYEVPVHHRLKQYMDAYMAAAGVADEKSSRLFRMLAGHNRDQVGARRMTKSDAHWIIMQRAREAGIFTRISSHSLRAAGITAYLLNGGSLKHAQGMAGHRSPHTTQFYGVRTRDISHDDVEKIRI